jgi:CMP-N-acetylneuraminic acid synthetase
MTLKDIVNLRYVINTKPYLYEVDSISAIDIDWPWQWKLAKTLYEEKLCK